MPSELDGARVLVTGGTGCIGSSVVRALLDRPVETIRILGRDESRQVELRDRLPADPRLEWWIGDVRERERVQEAVRGIDTIIHAAAMKHVAVCEENPREAFRNNVLGTERVLRAGIESGIVRFILVSTDKAVEPRGVLGLSKRMAERMVAAAQRSAARATLISVRLGNVLGSPGSLLPRVIGRLRRGDPIEVVDGEVTRFLVPVEEAARHVLAAASGGPGECIIPRMPAVAVAELVERCIEGCAPRLGVDPAAVRRARRPLGAGEKAHERLVAAEEAGRLHVEVERFRVAAAPAPGAAGIPPECRSESAPRLDAGGIARLLAGSGLVAELLAAEGWDA